MNRIDVEPGQLLWQPDEASIASANLTRFSEWLVTTGRSRPHNDYNTLWRWSVEYPEAFWEAIREYYRVAPGQQPDSILAEHSMPGATWFPGIRLNFSDYLLQQGEGSRTAVLFESESQPARTLTWDELREQVSCLANHLRALGIRPGDRVCGYLPNCPEALVALLASTAIGAVWSCCSPDFGSRSVLERFEQISPRVLIAVGGYRYNGRDFDRSEPLGNIIGQLDTLEQVIYLPWLDSAAPQRPAGPVILWQDALEQHPCPWEQLRCEAVAFDHPLWILYTSGTTGLPKGIVHGHGGVLLEFLKSSWLHDNLTPDTVKFYFSSTGWTMFNLLIGGLVTGCCVVLYDGSPMWPDEGALWELAERHGVTYFGANPAYIQRLIQSGYSPRDHFDLSRIQTFALTGSPATSETFAWIYQYVHDDVHVVSMSGGTDVAAAFVGGVPTLPVHAGRIQAPLLGVAACAFDDEGNELLDGEGELVITAPMPSMPIYLWNDPGQERYRSSYFDLYPGVWRQGDLIRFYPDHSCVIYGRSDATLNRKGIRIGTSEIYRAVEGLDGLVDSLVVNVERENSTESFMPLFVVLAADTRLDEALETRICEALRSACSPRHVPDAIIPVDAIPYTLSGKKLEVPVKRLMMGWPLSRAANLGAVANPESLNFFVDYARTRR